MTIDSNDILNSILSSLSRIDYVRPEDIPNIDLYMDQITTFMDAHLSSSKRYEEDKILTKTMINNYSKNHLLPPSEKKKYSKEHVLLLIFIYYFKNILSIKDIETLLSPLTEKFFHTDSATPLTSIYEEVCRFEKSRIEELQENVKEMYQSSLHSFENANEEDQNFLQLFMFICSLSFDVYVKKQMIEKMIDLLPEPEKKKKS